MAREGALGYDLGAPLLSGLYTLSRRGEQCSPTTDVTVASVRVNHRRIYHSHAPIEQWRGSTMCSPKGYPSKMNLHAVRRVVPQGTFSCGVAAIHLGAPYGILQSLLYARAAFAGMDKKKTACSHRRFSPIYF